MYCEAALAVTRCPLRVSGPRFIPDVTDGSPGNMGIFELATGAVCEELLCSATVNLEVSDPIVMGEMGASVWPDMMCSLAEVRVIVLLPTSIGNAVDVVGEVTSKAGVESAGVSIVGVVVERLFCVAGKLISAFSVSTDVCTAAAASVVCWEGEARF